MRAVSELDRKLIQLLSNNARASVAELARELGVTRATVQSHIQQLQQQGIIQGFTLRLSNAYRGTMIEAHVSIATEQRKVTQLCRKLEAMEDVGALYSISGEFDLVANIKSASTEDLDRAVDHISELDGVIRTQTSVVLSTKFER
ncbi:Lrp/AsnC family transcriptional regulator [uncultured Pseudoteredinibacter sp.]|uniref:Lrp/AsnC family transcriptional regulator n=1 Tax=uncultured Pseudoteredinibacter sp. TaxID=1641701 RepID=UPI0026024222|nr:Lrp/AsnC family transcriptional regulator [uncultured Pseudoteredinibacter sp.]